MFNVSEDLKVSYCSFTTEEGIKNNFSDNCLPPEVIRKFFSYLNVFELVRSQRVSKLWKEVVSDKALWEKAIIPRIIGKTHWKKCFGDIGEVPPLPKDIEQILESSCPFFLGKKVKETHMLVLIPEIIDNKPLTLVALGELIKAPKEGNATQYRNIWDAITQKYGQATPKAHWALMTKDVIEESRSKSYIDQKVLIAQYNEKTGMNYEVPNALDAAICIFMHYIDSGELLFTDEPLTFTRCLENIKDYQVFVGSFSLAGLDVNLNNFNSVHIGVAVLRKL